MSDYGSNRRPRSRAVRVAAVGAGAALIVLAASTAATAGARVQKADATVASGTASAVQAADSTGLPIGSGTYRASSDGYSVNASGDTTPGASKLTGRLPASAQLVQRVAAGVNKNGDRVHGASWSCAGLAADNATTTSSGTYGTTCLHAGDPVDVDLGQVDLSSLSVVSSTLLHGLTGTTLSTVQGRLGSVVPAANAALQSSLTAYGTPELVAEVGAAQAACASNSAGTAAVTTLTGATLRMVTPGQPDQVLSTLDSQPSPGTDVAADLSALPGLASAAVHDDLVTAVTTALGSAAGSVDEGAVVDNLLANLRSTQMAAFDQPLVSATLNKQSRPAAGSISVTALDLSVSDALHSFGVYSTAAKVGQVSCSSKRMASTAPSGTGTGSTGTGSTGTTGTTGTTTGSTTTGSTAAGLVPIKVDAGLGPDTIGKASPYILGAGMLVLGLGAGAVGAQAVARRRR